jgi:ribosomal protein L32E
VKSRSHFGFADWRRQDDEIDVSRNRLNRSISTSAVAYRTQKFNALEFFPSGEHVNRMSVTFPNEFPTAPPETGASKKRLNVTA